MVTIRQQLELYTRELSKDRELERAPLDEFKGLCVLLTTSIAVSKKIKEECKALEAQANVTLIIRRAVSAASWGAPKTWQLLADELEKLDTTELGVIYRELEESVRQVMAAEGYTDGEAMLQRSIDLRYTEQAHELTVPFVDDLDELAQAFSDEHERTYGHEAGAESVESVALRVAAQEPVEGSREEVYDFLVNNGPKGDCLLYTSPSPRD